MRRPLIVLISLASALVSATAFAYTAQQIQVTNDPAEQFDPAVSRGRVAWTDLRNGNADIYSYDIETAVETQITSGPANESLADINLDTIVYTTDRAGAPNYDVYAFDLVSMTESPVANTSVAESDPAVSAAYFVWTQGSSPSSVWALDRATSTAFAVSPSSNAQQHAAVSGTIAVWEERVGGVYDILAKDLLNGTTWTVASGATDSTSPDIDGNYVVYVNGGHIYWYDLSNGVGAAITTAGIQSNPHVSGPFVVWEDHSGTDSDLYGYDIQTGETRALATGPGDQFLHDISGYDIAYTDNSAGNTDIWVIHITPDSPNTDPCVANSGASVLFDETFARQPGEHHEKHRTFTAPAGMTTGTVCVDVTGTVAAEVELNEADILRPSDFDATTTSLERPVTLLETNRLEVEVRGPHHHRHLAMHSHHHGCDGDGDGDDQSCGGSGGGTGGTGGNGDPGAGGSGGGTGGSCDTGTIRVRVVGPLPPPAACTATIGGGAGGSLASMLLAGFALGLALARRRTAR